MSNQITFVAANDFGRPKDADRKLIRSHCMRGKNRKEDSRRSIRRAKKAQKSEAETTLEHGPHTSSHELTSALAGLRNIQSAKASEIAEGFPVELAARCNQSYSPFPERHLLDISVFSFRAIKQVVFPIEHCVDFSVFKTEFFPWILQDVVFFQSALLTTSAFFDLTSRQPPARKTTIHMRRTLSLLNNKLSEKDSYLIDYIGYIILILAAIAIMFEDLDAASSHISGLKKILQLRGGYDFLRRNPKLNFKVDRLDLSWSLSTGSKPQFSPLPVSWDSFFKPSRPFTRSSTILTSVEGLVDSRLHIVYEDLQHLTGMINDHMRANSMMNGQDFQDAVGSVQHRLLSLDDLSEDQLSERLRLAMLAFLTTIFCTFGIRAPYPHFAGQLRSAYQTPDISTPELRTLEIWALMVGMLSTLQRNEAWVCERWRMVAGEDASWDDMQKKLESVMWINCIHNAQGYQAFIELTDADACSST